MHLHFGAGLPFAIPSVVRIAMLWVLVPSDPRVMHLCSFPFSPISQRLSVHVRLAGPCHARPGGGGTGPLGPGPTEEQVLPKEGGRGARAPPLRGAWAACSGKLRRLRLIFP